MGLVLGDLLTTRRADAPSRPPWPDPRAAVLWGTADGLDWTLFGLGSAASVPGSLLGARLTGRLDERRLLQSVGGILLVAGTAMIVQGAV